ncbi:MAG: HAMP domain-containing protein, partial [Aeromicrobium sp.]
MIDALHRLVQKFTGRLSLALRVAVLTTMAVAVTLSVVSALVYVVVRAEFQNSLDDSMYRRAQAAVTSGINESLLTIPSARSLAYIGIQPFIVKGGELLPATNGASDYSQLKGYRELEVSVGQRERSARTIYLDGVPHRVVAVRAGAGTALVLVQSMESNQDALERLKVILLVSSIAGVAAAGVAGWAVAANGLRPVRRLTAATERVARTAELTPIEVTGRDELARLTTSFNAMLQALDASQERQRQLVADAGHELRTPLT